MALDIGRAGTGQLLHGQHRSCNQSCIVLDLGTNGQVEAGRQQVTVAIVQFEFHLKVGVDRSELQ
ncbi:hypothetical protein D3C80_1812000 [compost metagenome]